MSAFTQSHPPSTADEQYNDTLDILFNETDGILSTTEPQIDAYSGALPELDLDDLLNYPVDASGNKDILEEILASSEGDHCSPEQHTDDSSLGSPPFIPPTSKIDINVVSQDHAYLPTESSISDFTADSVEEVRFSSPQASTSSMSSSQIDMPLYLGDDLDVLEARQRSAPGPMRHSRRSRGSSNSFPGLPYTVHDLPLVSGSPPSPDSYNDDEYSRSPDNCRRKNDDNFGSPGDRLVLSEEERYLLSKEGVQLPDRLPLTREEERILRTIRRKIRNKISAKNSRLKKQEYVVGLEKRVKMCSKENRALRGSVDSLRHVNRQLMSEVRRLKNWITERCTPIDGSIGPVKVSGPVKAGLYTLFLSFALVLAPMLSPFWSRDVDGSLTPIMNKPSMIPGRTRALLQEREAAVDVGDPYRITVRPAGLPWQNPPQTAAIALPRIPPPENSVPVIPNATTSKTTNASNSSTGGGTETNEEALEEETDMDSRGDEL